MQLVQLHSVYNFYLRLWQFLLSLTVPIFDGKSAMIVLNFSYFYFIKKNVYIIKHQSNMDIRDFLFFRNDRIILRVNPATTFTYLLIIFWGPYMDPLDLKELITQSISLMSKYHDLERNRYIWLEFL